MASSALIDHYPSLPHSVSDYKQKLREKVEHDQQHGNGSFLDTIENLRQEQRARLAQVEHDYYNQLGASASLDLSHGYAHDYAEKRVTSKPPLPRAPRPSAAPTLHTEQRAQRRTHHRPASATIVQRHDDEIAFCPHRTLTGEQTTTVHDLTTEHVRNKLNRMWTEFDLDDYRQQRKRRHSTTAASWAGRITIPEPFDLSQSVNANTVHERKCLTEAGMARLRKEIDDEVNLGYSFKAKAIPAHVHLPLYEQMQEDQRLRSEQTRQQTKEYLTSIQKPFGFIAREKAKSILRRHSFAGGDLLQPLPQFRATPMPDFYHQQQQDNELSQEKELHRSAQKELRAKELLRQSRSPFSRHKPKFLRRSKSASDILRHVYREHAFKPKTNGYYIPNHDKNYARFVQSMEDRKRTRSPTKCQPFVLYTNMIPSNKEKVLDDIRKDAAVRHAQTFQIKGKLMLPKPALTRSLSASLHQPEFIPAKTTEAQRLREAVGKKKRWDEAVRSSMAEAHQRSQSAKDRRVRETIRARGELQDKAMITKAKRDENNRKLRQSMRDSENAYAKSLDEMKERVQKRPLLLEQDQRKKAVQDLQKKIQRAMDIANATD